MKTWGPPVEPDPLALRMTCGIDDLGRILDSVRRISSLLEVPVQVVRADRVLSAAHVAMAKEHARRTRAAGRQRADDPAVEFLLFTACDRQIHRAVAALGLPDTGGVDLVAVALEATDPVRFRNVTCDHLQGEPNGPLADPQARSWWAARLGRDADAPVASVETALLARMALLALDKP